MYESGNRSPYLLAYLVDLASEKNEQGDGDKDDYVKRAIKVILFFRIKKCAVKKKSEKSKIFYMATK